LRQLPSFFFNGTCFQENVVQLDHAFLMVVPGANDLGAGLLPEGPVDNRYL
jgi:hypothetical protein